MVLFVCEVGEIFRGRFVELPSGPHSVDGDVAEFTDPMKKIALRLVAIGGTGAYA